MTKPIRPVGDFTTPQRGQLPHGDSAHLPFGGDMRAIGESQHRWRVEHNGEQAVREARDTRELIEALVNSATDAEARETKMLFWTRVAGVGAILALAVAIVGIIVTVVVS